MQASNAIVSNTKPETFMLSQEQQDHLPYEAKQALEQVDDRMISYRCLVLTH